MGGGTVSHTSFRSYADTRGYDYDIDTGRMRGQSYTARRLDKALDPKNFKVRECCNSEEHPNTIPVILALDVTGSMGEACSEVAAALGSITTGLYEKFKDVEFCIMGIGDLAYDHAPIQMSQFESDIRIAESLDKVWMEKGGGGNNFESYTAAWYMGLHHTKLDCWKQGRKGIIITMGDEPLNPYLPVQYLKGVLSSCTAQADVETGELYKEASEKFDIFHIAVDSVHDSYSWYQGRIERSFGPLLGDRLKVSDIQNLAKTIEQCITEAVSGIADAPVVNPVNDKGEISW